MRSEALKPPLWNLHAKELKADMGVFAGWEVPMLYTSSIDEYKAVRGGVAVFDVSHMGRFRVKGPDALPLLQLTHTRDFSRVKEGWLSGPSLVLNEFARVKDDEMAYKISEEEWLLVVNASARNKMLAYYRGVASGHGLKVEIEDLTLKIAMLAIQGPKSSEVLSKLGASWVDGLHTLEFRVNVEVAGEKVFLLSRSGWTGEDGFEVWAEPSVALRIFRELLGKGVKPAGLVCRDMLRIEMGYVLGGHEYGEDPGKFPPANSLRYGMGAISWHKTGFIGEKALKAYRREGVRWVRVGLKMAKRYARLIPRQGLPVYVEDQAVGWVTSGTYSPLLKRSIGQAYIDVRYALASEEVEVKIRGKRCKAKIVDFPVVPGKPVIK